MENTEDQRKKVKFNKPQQTKKASRADSTDRALDNLAKYVLALEKGTADIRNNLTIAIGELYKEVYKDCPTFKEIDFNENNLSEFQKVIGVYCKRGEEIVRIIPVEEGWKLAFSEKTKYVIEGQNEGQEVDGLKVQFKYEGITESADYPTEFECFAQTGHEAIMKLKNYLFSLKKEIVLSSGTTNS